MSHLRVLLMIAVCAVIWLPSAPRAEGQEKRAIIEIDVVKLIKENSPTAREDITKALQKRLTGPLMKLARTQRKFELNTPREIAVELLGDLRVAEAAKALVEDIDYFPPGEGGLERTIMYFPCAKALINIGLPAIEMIFHRCEDKIEDKNLILYAWVISQIDGDDVGKYRVELELKKATAPDKKRNLEKLLKAYKEKKDSFPVREFLPPGK